MTRSIALLLMLLAAAASAAPDSPPETALADYVAAPDPSFEWRVHARYSAPAAEVVELRLHSQTWRGALWKHQLFLIKPDDLGADVDRGLLVIGGGRWREQYETEAPAELPEDAELFIGMAAALDTVVAVLGQVPFQPLFGMNEDELIAFTFDRYLESGDAEWPLLLPMVKSAVRAMDAAQAFAAEQWRVALDEFTVLGGSKRGWTTWLTGAVDSRAAVLVPVVIDALNFAAHMPYQTAVWGAPSRMLAPYTERGLHEVLGAEGGEDLRTIVDPYSYRQRLTQPKLVVVATNDEYFPLDALNLYWDELEEPKHVLYLPNDEHSIEDFARLIPALAAVHRAGAGDAALPDVAWEFEERAALRLCVRAAPAPAAVHAWVADSADGDFRDSQFLARAMTPSADGFILDLDPPAAGFSAAFAEVVFGAGEARYSLSTNVRVVGAAGRARHEATAIRGERGVCP